MKIYLIYQEKSIIKGENLSAADNQQERKNSMGNKDKERMGDIRSPKEIKTKIGFFFLNDYTPDPDSNRRDDIV